MQLNGHIIVTCDITHNNVCLGPTSQLSQDIQMIWNLDMSWLSRFPMRARLDNCLG